MEIVGKLEREMGDRCLHRTTDMKPARANVSKGLTSRENLTDSAWSGLRPMYMFARITYAHIKEKLVKEAGFARRP